MDDFLAGRVAACAPLGENRLEVLQGRQHPPEVGEPGRRGGGEERLDAGGLRVRVADREGEAPAAAVRVDEDGHRVAGGIFEEERLAALRRLHDQVRQGGNLQTRGEGVGHANEFTGALQRRRELPERRICGHANLALTRLDRRDYNGRESPGRPIARLAGHRECTRICRAAAEFCGTHARRREGADALSPSPTTLFQGKIFRVDREEVSLPDGRVSAVEAVRHPGGAAAAAVDESGRVCLLRQYRPVVAAWVWELPAGKRDGTEDFARTASRELREEAGIEAARWTRLGAVFTTPGFCDEVLHLFLARGLTVVETSREEHEIMEVHWMPLDEAVGKALAGEFSDAKTVIGLLRATAAIEEEKE